jgi:uncharacterized protein (TIGR03435 family)
MSDLRKIWIRRVSFLIFASALYAPAQTTEPPSFEVATIKLAPTPSELLARNMPQPRSLENESIFESYSQLVALLFRAYRLDPYQKVLAPDWVYSTYYEIHAKMPKAATRSEVPDMIRVVLAEQLKLSTHFEEREQTVFVLAESEGGIRLTEASKDLAADSRWTPKGKTIVPSIGPGGRAVFSELDGKIFYENSRLSVGDLSRLLAAQLGQPVIDRTELKASYQVLLLMPGEAIRNTLAGAHGPIGLPHAGIGGPSATEMAAAVAPLGLKLEKARVPIKNLVVDHVEKTPIGN